MGVIHVEHRDGRRFAVEVAEEELSPAPGRSFHYTVTVDDATLDAVGMAGADEARLASLVRESFAFLLAREPATSIMSTFSLSVIPTYFPEYHTEMRTRMG